MLTVKMIHGSGEEIIFEATEVRKAPDSTSVANVGYLTICPPDGADYITYPIRSERPADGSDDMTFFVMNRHGATVARYCI
jgi:hypothetical protein